MLKFFLDNTLYGTSFSILAYILGLKVQTKLLTLKCLHSGWLQNTT